MDFSVQPATLKDRWTYASFGMKAYIVAMAVIGSVFLMNVNSYIARMAPAEPATVGVAQPDRSFEVPSPPVAAHTPTEAPAVIETPIVTPEPARPEPQPEPAEPAPATPSAPFAYANCDAVRAAGAAPIRVGDYGWDPKFDRDGDGVGCEP